MEQNTSNTENNEEIECKEIKNKEIDCDESNNKITFSNKQLLIIILPLFLETILGIAVGMIDTIMVSSVGESAVSGVSLVDAINFLFIGIFTSLATGGYVIISQAIGRNSTKDACEYSNQMVLSISVISFIIMVISLVFNNQILNLVYKDVEKDVMDNAIVYFYLTTLSYPFLALHSACSSVFRSMGNTKVPLYVSILLNIINVCGNYMFIVLLNWNAAGVGMSTLIARIVGSAILLVLALNKKNLIYLTNPMKWRFDGKIVRKMLNISIPTAIDGSIFQIGKIVLQSITVAFGTSAIAANAVSSQLATFTVMPGNVLGIVLMMVTGRFIGARDFANVKYYTKKLVLWSICGIFLVNVILLLLLDPIIGLYNLTDTGKEITRNLLIFNAIVSTLFWAVSFTLPNMLRAANDARFTMVVSIVSMWTFRIGFSYLLCLQFNMGVLGIWIAMSIDWIFRDILFVHRFKSEKWITSSIEM